MKAVPYMNTDNPRIAAVRFAFVVVFVMGLGFTLLDGLQKIDILLVPVCIYGIFGLALHLWDDIDVMGV